MSSELADEMEPFFSSEGRLLQVERAFKAIERENITAVALKGNHCAVVATQKLSSGKHVEAETTTNLFNLDGSIGGCVIGRRADAQHQTDIAKDVAFKFMLEFGYQIPVDVHCHRMANINQVCTQNTLARELGFSMIMISYDDVTGPAVYKTDSSANCSGFRACAVGASSVEATEFLEQKYRNNLSEDSAIQLAIACLAHVRCNGNQPETIEVGVVSQREPNFRILSVRELEESLANVD